MSVITVLFATFNGAHTLPRMLDQLERLQPPTGGWEVIAVDNGSSDDSLKIMTERAKRLRMTVLSEPRRGKNVALNTALPLANGDIIAFTDDDIILSPDWLVCIERIAAQQPEYDIFGGPIYPVWEKPAPDWVLRNAPKGFLGWADFPEGPIDVIQIWGGRRTRGHRHAPQAAPSPHPKSATATAAPPAPAGYSRATRRFYAQGPGPRPVSHLGL